VRQVGYLPELYEDARPEKKGTALGHRQIKFGMEFVDTDIYIYFLIYIHFLINGCRKGQPKV